MNATVYSFSPTPSHYAQRSHWALTLLLLVAVISWPSHWWWLSVLQALLCTAIVVDAWRRSPQPPMAFSLDEQGHGRLLNGQRFYLSGRSRLLPWGALLHSDETGWYWLWKDSIDDTHWRRLCRLALRASQGREW